MPIGSTSLIGALACTVDFSANRYSQVKGRIEYPFNVPVPGVFYGEESGLATGDKRTNSVPSGATPYAEGARATCLGWKLYQVDVDTGAATLWLEDTSNVCEYEHPGVRTRLVWQWALQDQIATYGAPGSEVEWADRKYWTAGGDGSDWHDPANWSPAGVPTLANTAYIESGTAYIPSNAVAARIVVAEGCGLYLGSTGTVTAAIGAFPTAETNRCLSLALTENLLCSGGMALGGRWQVERDVIITNLTVDVGGDFVLSGAGNCAIYANTMTNAITWTNLYRTAAMVNVAGDLKVLDNAILYPTADRLTGNPVRFRCQNFQLDGAPQPGYGTVAYARQSVQTFACEGYGYDPANPANVRFTCVGYVVSNSTEEVTRGTTDNFTITIGNRPLYVYWIWGDRHVRMPVCVPEHATVKANNTEFTQSGALWLTEETVPVLETIAEASG